MKTPVSLTLFRRLFSGKAYFNIASWTLVGLVSAWTIAFFFGQLCQCVPIEANWLGPDAGNAVCIDELKLYLIGAWSDAIMDGTHARSILSLILTVSSSNHLSVAFTDRKFFLTRASTVRLSNIVPDLEFANECRTEMRPDWCLLAWCIVR